MEEKKKAKQIDIVDLEKRAKDYAKARSEAAGVDYDDMTKKALEMMNAVPGAASSEPAPAPAATPEEEPMPAGWAIAKDANQRAYYWHKKTQKTIWERPTADTPIN